MILFNENVLIQKILSAYEKLTGFVFILLLSNSFRKNDRRKYNHTFLEHCYYKDPAEELF